METDELCLPSYRSGALSDVLPTIAANLGLPGFDVTLPAVPKASRYVVLLVDGLGWHMIRSAISYAPYLAGLFGDAVCITSGVPSTTATSLTSLGTGLAPGQHGVPGYTFRDPHSGRLLCSLAWPDEIPPRAYQAKPTVFQTLQSAGVAMSVVSLAYFEGSGLTELGLRGGEFVGLADETDDDRQIDEVVAAAARGVKSVVYTYERLLDHTGHTCGWRSDAWLDQLIRIDSLISRLRDSLPVDTRLLVTGDHGMVNVPDERKLIAEDTLQLLRGVRLIAGEGRLRQIYGDSPDAIARNWRTVLGERAWVHTREQVAETWFGGMDPNLADRFGDVVVAMRDDWAVLTRQFPGEATMIGMHGSLTAGEMQIPLFVD